MIYTITAAPASLAGHHSSRRGLSMSEYKPSNMNWILAVIGTALFGWVGMNWGTTFDVTPEGTLAGYFVKGIAVLFALSAINEFRKIRALTKKRDAAKTPSTLYGQAQFAERGELANAGMFDPSGLYLGSFGAHPIFFTGKAHLLTEAPARTGKGINVVIPNLLHFQGSVFVTDPKGELAAVTGQHRADQFGHNVIYLNPWGLHDLPQHRFNPLGVLIALAADKKTQPLLFDEARSIANQLIPEPEGGGENTYFRDGGREILQFLMIHLAIIGNLDQCTLPELLSTIRNTEKLMEAVAAMIEEDHILEGGLSDFGQELKSQISDNPKQFADFKKNATSSLSLFQKGAPLGVAVSRSDFSLADLKRTKTTIYVIVPSRHVRNVGRWISLISQQAIDAVADTKGDVETLFLLDEFANMGKLAGLEESLTALPGLGVRVWMIVQDMNALKRIYGEHTTSTILSQAEVRQYFSIESDERAKELSEAFGNRTEKALNVNMGKSENDEVGESFSDVGVPLIRPEELQGLPKGKQVLRVKNVRPVIADLTPYWSVSPWIEWAADNPVEGSHPRDNPPMFTLSYKKRS